MRINIRIDLKGRKKWAENKKCEYAKMWKSEILN